MIEFLVELSSTISTWGGESMEQFFTKNNWPEKRSLECQRKIWSENVRHAADHMDGDFKMFQYTIISFEERETQIVESQNGSRCASSRGRVSDNHVNKRKCNIQRDLVLQIWNWVRWETGLWCRTLNARRVLSIKRFYGWGWLSLGRQRHEAR